jgi:AcrR family transcriptional regulator
VDAGPDGAAEMEKYHQAEQGDDDDDADEDRPPRYSARASGIGLSGAVRIAGGRELLSHSFESFRPTLSEIVSRQVVYVKPLCLVIDSAYTSRVPKLWTETIATHRREVHDAILDTTASLVAEHGLLGVTMSQIAEETGIGRATLYKYFPDVESILLEWHDREIRAHLAHLSEVRDQRQHSGERLEAVLEAYALLSRPSRGHRDARFADLLHRDDRLGRAQREVHEMIRDLLAAAAREGRVRDDVPPDELASYCVHALGGGDAQLTKASIRRLVAVTMDALRPRP